MFNFQREPGTCSSLSITLAMITGVQKMMMMVLSMKMATQMAQMLEIIFTRMKMIVQKFIGESD